MANPRKFSEKISLHMHRQAEETARFEQIMKEVLVATARPEDNAVPPQPSMSPHSPHSPQHHNTNTHYRESRARSQGGPIRRPQDRKHDTSPYSSGPFLSPPPDTSWRRTNSDSALHQSAMQGICNDRNDTTNSHRWMQNMNGPSSLNHHDQHEANRRPRSSCEMPRVPGINIFHTEYEPGTVPIPIGNNTGSLPDLTSVHSYPSPLHTPVDPDQEHQGSSPYSSNHLSVPVNSRYLHHNKGVTIDNGTLTQLDHHQDFTQMTNMNRIYQQQSAHQQQQQQVPPASPSPTLQQVAGYRSPRPSPQSSPSLGGRHSAPCSPGAPSPLSPLPNDYQLYNQHQAAQLQQHFEQISMMDTPVNTYMTPQTNNAHLKSQNQQQSGMQDIGLENTGDAGYCSTSPSQLVYHTAPPSLHTTPNTPTIILTDFSGDDISQQESLQKQLENELFCNDMLRECLEPLDQDSLQILSDSGVNLISDSVEDHFRLDRS